MEPIRSSFEDDADMMEIVREFAADAQQRAEDCELDVAEHRGERDAERGEEGEQRRDHEQAAEESAIKEASGRVCEVLRAVYAAEPS